MFAAAFLIASIGVMPHLWLSQSSHEISYFKYAYDEEFYGGAALDAHRAKELHRIASGVLLRGLHAVGGGNLQATLIVSDFVWPFLSTLAAGYLASAITRRATFRLLLILLLLFTQEFFSMGCSAVWTSAWNLARLRGLLPPWGAMLVPDYSSSYFSLYRTPEPQISWIFEFTCLGLLVRHFCDDQRNPKPRHWGALLILDLCLSVSLVFCALPVLALQLLLAGRALLDRREKHFAAVGGLALLAMAALLAPGNNAGMALIFESRLPILSPAVVASAVTVALIMARHGSEALRSRRMYLSLALATIPSLLMNQQLVTGRMISTRDWERYANYPLLVMGIALSSLGPTAMGMVPNRLKSLSPLLGVAALTVLLGRGQKISFDQWRTANELVMAQLAAIRSFPSGAEPLRLVLEDVGAAPLLQVKTDRPIHFVMVYDELFGNPISTMPKAGGSPAGRQEHQERLFEHFARSGKSAEDVAQILRGEATQRGGFYLGFLFSFLDYWYPASDNRRVRQDEIVSQIGPIVNLYEQYELTPHDRWRETTFFLTTTPPEKLKPNKHWTNSLWASGHSGTNSALTVYAYRQTLRLGESASFDPH